MPIARRPGTTSLDLPSLLLPLPHRLYPVIHLHPVAQQSAHSSTSHSYPRSSSSQSFAPSAPSFWSPSSPQWKVGASCTVRTLPLSCPTLLSPALPCHAMPRQLALRALPCPHSLASLQFMSSLRRGAVQLPALALCDVVAYDAAVQVRSLFFDDALPPEADGGAPSRMCDTPRSRSSGASACGGTAGVPGKVGPGADHEARWAGAHPLPARRPARRPTRRCAQRAADAGRPRAMRARRRLTADSARVSCRPLRAGDCWATTAAMKRTMTAHLGNSSNCFNACCPPFRTRSAHTRGRKDPARAPGAHHGVGRYPAGEDELLDFMLPPRPRALDQCRCSRLASLLAPRQTHDCAVFRSQPVSGVCRFAYLTVVVSSASVPAMQYTTSIS
jgi:hypothetical protein